SSLEHLTGRLSSGKVTELASQSEDLRLRGLEGFRRASATTGRAIEKPSQKPGRIVVSFAREDFDRVASVARSLVRRLGDVIWWEGDNVLPGDDWDKVVSEAFDAAEIVLACFGPGWIERAKHLESRMFEPQVLHATERGAHVVPVLLDGVTV